MITYIKKIALLSICLPIPTCQAMWGKQMQLPSTVTPQTQHANSVASRYQSDSKADHETDADLAAVFARCDQEKVQKAMDEIIQQRDQKTSKINQIHAMFAGFDPKFKRAAFELSKENGLDCNAEIEQVTQEIAARERQEAASKLAESLTGPDLSEAEKLELAQFYEQHSPKELIASLKSLLIEKHGKRLRTIAKIGQDSESLGASLPLDGRSFAVVGKKLHELSNRYSILNTGGTFSQKIPLFLTDLSFSITLAYSHALGHDLNGHRDLDQRIEKLSKSYAEIKRDIPGIFALILNLNQLDMAQFEKDFALVKRYVEWASKLKRLPNGYRVTAVQTAASAATADPTQLNTTDSLPYDIFQDLSLPQLLLALTVTNSAPVEQPDDIHEPVYTALLRSLNQYPELKQRMKKNLASNLMISTLNAPREVTKIVVSYLGKIPGNKKKKKRRIQQHNVTGCVIS